MGSTHLLRFGALFTTFLVLGEALSPGSVQADEPPRRPGEEPAAPRPRRSSRGEDAPNAFVLEGAMRVDVQRLDMFEGNPRNPRVNRSDSARTLGGALYLGLMVGIHENIRVGGGFAWGGSLGVEPDEEDATGLGQLLMLDVRLDVLLPVKRELFVIITPNLGLSIISPGDELRAKIDSARNLGLNTWRGPRLGLMFGVDAGVRWEATSWFALRGTVGYQWSWSPLLRSSQESASTSTELDWTLSTHRLRIAVGAEVTF